MKKFNTWVVYLISNSVEILAIVLFLNGYKGLANVLPVYLTIITGFVSIVFISMVILLIAFESDKDKYFDSVKVIKTIDTYIPTWITVPVEIGYLVTFSMLMWYYSAFIVFINLVLALLLRALLKSLKESILKRNKYELF